MSAYLVDIIIRRAIFIDRTMGGGRVYSYRVAQIEVLRCVCIDQQFQHTTEYCKAVGLFPTLIWTHDVFKEPLIVVLSIYVLCAMNDIHHSRDRDANNIDYRNSELEYTSNERSSWDRERSVGSSLPTVDSGTCPTTTRFTVTCCGRKVVFLNYAPSPFHRAPSERMHPDRSVR